MKIVRKTFLYAATALIAISLASPILPAFASTVPTHLTVSQACVWLFTWCNYMHVNGRLTATWCDGRICTTEGVAGKQITVNFWYTGNQQTWYEMTAHPTTDINGYYIINFVCDVICNAVILGYGYYGADASFSGDITYQSAVACTGIDPNQICFI